MAQYGRSTALIVVDVQNDFADPGGALAVRGAADILPLIDREIEDATSGGATVVYTQDWHPESTPHFQKDGGIWPVHCVNGTWGAELHPGLTVAGPVVRKGSNGEDGYSGFTMRDPTTSETKPTELDAMLRERGIRRLVVVGLATDYCVRATALDGRALGYETAVRDDAIRAVDLQPGDGERALEDLRSAGVRVEQGNRD